MRLELYPIDKLKKEILEILAGHLDLRSYRVFFFGSRVTGKGHEHSDVDIGVEGPDEIPYEVMARIREEIEDLPTLYRIEIVDFKKVSPDFREVALQRTEIIS